MVSHSPSSSLCPSGEESDWEDENSSFHFFLFFGGGSAFTLGCLALGFTEETFVAVGFGVGGSGGLMLLLLGLQWIVLQYYEKNVYEYNYHTSFGSYKIAIIRIYSPLITYTYFNVTGYLAIGLYTLHTLLYFWNNTWPDNALLFPSLKTGKLTGMLTSELQCSVP